MNAPNSTYRFYIFCPERHVKGDLPGLPHGMQVEPETIVDGMVKKHQIGCNNLLTKMMASVKDLQSSNQT